jgi:hypothetical protein
MTTDLIHIGRRLVPLEEIALIEPYTPDAERPLQTERAFRSRVTMVDRSNVLSERSVTEFVEAQAFRMIEPDGVAANPRVVYWVEKFEPTEAFQPEKPYLARLLWRAQTGLAHSKLLLAPPEQVLAVAVRGQSEPQGAPAARRARSNDRRAPARRKAAAGPGPA